MAASHKSLLILVSRRLNGLSSATASHCSLPDTVSTLLIVFSPVANGFSRRLNGLSRRLNGLSSATASYCSLPDTVSTLLMVFSPVANGFSRRLNCA